MGWIITAAIVLPFLFAWYAFARVMFRKEMETWEEYDRRQGKYYKVEKVCYPNFDPKNSTEIFLGLLSAFGLALVWPITLTAFAIFKAATSEPKTKTTATVSANSEDYV